jgi:hypothetical protein
MILKPCFRVQHHTCARFGLCVEWELIVFEWEKWRGYPPLTYEWSISVHLIVHGSSMRANVEQEVRKRSWRVRSRHIRERWGNCIIVHYGRTMPAFTYEWDFGRGQYIARASMDNVRVGSSMHRHLSEHLAKRTKGTNVPKPWAKVAAVQYESCNHIN